MDDVLGKKLGRMKTRMDRFSKAVETRLNSLEGLYKEYAKQCEAEKEQLAAEKKNEEETLKADVDQAANDFTRSKYAVEKDAAIARTEIGKAQDSIHRAEANADHETARLREEKTKHQISIEKQKSALHELYQEQKRHLLTQREKLIQKYAQLDKTYQAARAKFQNEAAKLRAEKEEQLTLLRDQVNGKKEGWQNALAAIKREYELLAKERADIEAKLGTVREEKEKELEETRIAIKMAKEQLEIDKATIVEKAEEDQRRCAADVRELEEKVNKTEIELQNLILNNEAVRKDAEEGFQKEEALLKEALKAETEKRDYEQKLYQEEKTGREKQLNGLREEYEKKKWHWENQVRALTMKKSVQEAEFEAERMRIDREARVSFRSLEAKRDELKQRLSDLKNRYETLSKNASKEKELMSQRWQWRRDRLWSMWQNRLDVIKQERAALHDQLDQLMSTFTKEKGEAVNKEAQEEQKVSELQQFVFHLTDQIDGSRKQREIQIELEKTRFLAQIKECETLIGDWLDRLKATQEDLAAFNTQFGGQMNFAERIFRDEEQETQLFLHDLQRAMTLLGAKTESTKTKDAA